MAEPPPDFPPENHLSNGFPPLAQAHPRPSETAPPSSFPLTQTAAPPTGILPNGFSGKKQPPSFIKALNVPSTSIQNAARNLKKSFHNMSQGSSAIPVRTPVVVNGKLEISFSEKEVEILAQPLKFALVGKFSGRRPEFKLVCSEIARMAFKGVVSVRALKPGYVLIQADLEDDFSLLWSSSKWLVAGAYMRLFKWCPNFSYNSESSIASVWVAFPDLPLHLFEKTVLFSIASAIGTPLKLDEPTANRSRPSVARVNIEVDLCSERKHEICIKMGNSETGLLQHIFYENLPEYCAKCKHRGHTSLSCKKEEFIRKNQAKKQPESAAISGAVGAVLELKKMTENSLYTPQNNSGITVQNGAGMRTNHPPLSPCTDLEHLQHGSLGSLCVPSFSGKVLNLNVPPSLNILAESDTHSLHTKLTPPDLGSAPQQQPPNLHQNGNCTPDMEIGPSCPLSVSSPSFDLCDPAIIHSSAEFITQHIHTADLGLAPAQQPPNLHQKGNSAPLLELGPSCSIPDSNPPFEPFVPSNINQLSTSALIKSHCILTPIFQPDLKSISQKPSISAQFPQLELEGCLNLFDKPSRPIPTLQRSPSIPKSSPIDLSQHCVSIASLKQPCLSIISSVLLEQRQFSAANRNCRSIKAGPVNCPLVRSHSLPPTEKPLKYNIFLNPKALAFRKILARARNGNCPSPYTGYYSPLVTIQDPTSTPSHTPPSPRQTPQPPTSPNNSNQLGLSLPSHPVTYSNSFFEAVVHPSTPKTYNAPKRITPVTISSSTSHANYASMMDKNSYLKQSELQSQKSLVGLVGADTNSSYTGCFSEFISDMGNSQESTKSYAERLKIKKAKKKARRKGHHQG